MANREDALAHLEHANRVRLSRSKVLHAFNRGELTLRQVLEHPDIQTAAIIDVLRQKRQWRWKRSRRVLVRCAITENRQVKMLTERQINAVINEVEPECTSD